MVPGPPGVTAGPIKASKAAAASLLAPWRLATGGSQGMVCAQQSRRVDIGVCRCHFGSQLGSIGRWTCKKAGEPIFCLCA